MRIVTPAFVLITFLALSVPTSAQAPRVSGRVVDAETGRPVPARIENLDTHAFVNADPDGRFTLEIARASRATLVISSPGYYVQRATVEPSATADLEVHLSPVVTVTDTVEVTASRVREGADAQSFTNVPQEKVADTYWGQDPAVLISQIVPGVFTSNDSGNGIGYSYFSIRGFGQARTRVMLNGAPLNDAESGELFFIDLADFMSTSGDVQVQRGVSGLSGLGGALDFTTRAPAVRPNLSVQVGAGSFNTRRLTMTWDSGLIDGTWAFAARYSKLTTDGYRDQSWVDMWNYYFSAARYGARSRLRAVFFGGPERTHLAYDGVDRQTLDGGISGDADRDRRTNPIAYPGEIDNFFQPHYQLVHDVTFSDRTRFSQTLYGFQGSGYYDQFRERRWLFEYGLPSVRMPGGTDVTRTDLVRRRSVDEWDAGWVPAFSHQFGSLGVDLTGEWRIHRAHHVGEVTWAQYYPVGIDPNHRYYDYRVSKDTAAGAVTARLAVTPRVTLTGGLQVTRHAYELSDDQVKHVAFTRAYAFVLPRAGAVVKVAPGGEAYASVARGMREPFFRNLYDPQDYYSTVVSLDPEDVWNVEAGTSWRGPGWRVRGNAYWMHFRNEIVYAGALDDNGVPVYGNGARSRRLGVELDGSATIAGRYGVDAALSVSRNTFLSYKEHDFEGGTVVYDGNRVAGFPALMASVSARADVGPSRLSLSLRHVGRFFLDNTGSASLVNPAYTTADAAARISFPERVRRGLGFGPSSIDIRVNNLLDRRYTSFGYVDGGVAMFIPAAGRNAYVGLTFGF